jgi:hypothetical protein
MKLVFTTFVVLVSSLNLFAQPGDSTTIKTQIPEKQNSSKGFRVTALRPNWDVEISLSFRGQKVHLQSKIYLIF